MSQFKIIGETVSNFNAHNPDYKSPYAGKAKKIMRLHKGDMVATGDQEARRIWCVARLSGQVICLMDHRFYNQPGYSWGEAYNKKHLINGQPVAILIRASKALEYGLRRIKVTPTGRVSDPGFMWVDEDGKVRYGGRGG